MDEKRNAEEVNVSAEEMVSDNVPEIVSDPPESERNKRPYAVNELRALRGENSKVYQMSDGTERAVFYPEAKHVYDEDTGCFEDIDNTLTEEEDNRYVRNGKGRFRARFSRDENDDELFSVEKGIYRIAVSAKKHSKERNHGVVPVLHKAVKEMERDRLVFGEAMADTDLEYMMTENGVKENIIIKKKANVYRYPFILECTNVVAEHLEDENRVIFTDPESGGEVFCIPAPFMTDANGVLSSAVTYGVKQTASGKINLTVIADSDWINAEDRVFPITIDPQIEVSGSSNMTMYSWIDGTMSYGASHRVGIADSECGNTTNRMYMHINLPTLPRNPLIKNAMLTFKQIESAITSSTPLRLGLYYVASNPTVGTNTPVYETDLIDYAAVIRGASASYTFDITAILDRAAKTGSASANLVLKLIDEDTDVLNSIVLSGTDSSNAPELTFDYESNYAMNAHLTDGHELGRFGHGSIDLQCGNLMFESTDFAWRGNRMPVTIKHQYNSILYNRQYTYSDSIKLNAASFSNMKLGYGWKLNLMQSMRSTSFFHNGEQVFGYVYTDENGGEIFFIESDELAECTGACYYLYEDIDNYGIYYDPQQRKLYEWPNSKVFDDSGRLVRIIDDYNNQIIINYTTNRITSVTDGAGREFGFTYNSAGYLTSITAPDGNSVCYSYLGNYLSGIVYPNGERVTIEKNATGRPTSVVLKDASSTEVYRVDYTYIGNRVSGVAEYGMNDGAPVLGASTAYSYSEAARTITATTTEQMDSDEGECTDSVITTVYCLDEYGNFFKSYRYSQNAGIDTIEEDTDTINPFADDEGVTSNADNLLKNHCFNGLNNWTGCAGNSDDFAISNYAHESYAKYGSKVLRMQSISDNTYANGVYQETIILPAGEYTLSAFLRNITDFSGESFKGSYLRITNLSGDVIAQSEHLVKKSPDFERLIVPFVLKESQSVRVCIIVDGKGTVYADAVQLENNAYANEYNLIENGNFEDSDLSGNIGTWSSIGGVTSFVGISITEDTKFNMSKALCISGDLGKEYGLCQNVQVKKKQSTRETFTLSGWAKAIGSVPDHERATCNDPVFEVRAEINYSDNSTETHIAKFVPGTEDWQMANISFAKEEFKAVDHIRVVCEYSYNSGVAYFDNIQLVRNGIETDLASSDFVAMDDADEDDVTDIIDEVAEDTIPEFKEVVDAYGNTLTETTFTDGELGTIYRSFEFTPDCNGIENAGNDLIRETDACGNEITYTVDEETSRNEEVTDRCGNKTAYEYDAEGRIIKVTNKDASNSEIANFEYTYNSFGDLTEIVRGDGLKYGMTYDEFHNLKEIGVGGEWGLATLVNNTYKTGNGRLKSVTYGNGHTMKLAYNSIGQIISGKWYSESNVLNSYCKYVYDGQGNIVRSIDILGEKEYTYIYDDGRIERASEYNIVLNENGFVTSRTLVNSIIYVYGYDGNLIRKHILPSNDTEQVIYYENAEDQNTVVKFVAGGKTVTSHSKTDNFGRKIFDELQLGTGFVSRQYEYYTGTFSGEHAENKKLKSTPTTQLVRSVLFANGRTLGYEYDAEERITKVIDSEDGVTEYTYDALGQLLTETKDGTVVNSMTYDNHGNILTKNGIEYSYANGIWNDLLLSYGDQSTSPDGIGNPMYWRGYSLTWEKGRQLKSFGNNSYTYNANGVRISKTVNGIRHDFEIEGSKILRETWNSNTLIPVYDNEDNVCGIRYNDEPYYFMKNLQGDIISVTNKSGTVVAKYSYDAWGACAVVQNSSDNIGAINPFRYRGYYYDVESGLYYLQSRYYDSSIGRFLNLDNVNLALFTESNLFVYCSNNVVNYHDPSGYCYEKTYDAPKLSNCFVLGATNDLGNGWRYRIDNKNTPQEHIHVWNRKKSKGQYAQNKNGGPHDDHKNGPGSGPPKKVKEQLKDKGWDWDGKAKKYASNSTDYNVWMYAISTVGAGYLIYRGARMLISALPPLWWTAPANLVFP